MPGGMATWRPSFGGLDVAPAPRLPAASAGAGAATMAIGRLRSFPLSDPVSSLYCWVPVRARMASEAQQQVGEKPSCPSYAELPPELLRRIFQLGGPLLSLQERWGDVYLACRTWHAAAATLHLLTTLLPPCAALEGSSRTPSAKPGGRRCAASQWSAWSCGSVTSPPSPPGRWSSSRKWRSCGCTAWVKGTRGKRCTAGWWRCSTPCRGRCGCRLQGHCRWQERVASGFFGGCLLAVFFSGSTQQPPRPTVLPALGTFSPSLGLPSHP